MKQFAYPYHGKTIRYMRCLLCHMFDNLQNSVCWWMRAATFGARTHRLWHGYRDYELICNNTRCARSDVVPPKQDTLRHADCQSSTCTALPSHTCAAAAVFSAYLEASEEPAPTALFTRSQMPWPWRVVSQLGRVLERCLCIPCLSCHLSRSLARPTSNGHLISACPPRDKGRVLFTCDTSLANFLPTQHSPLIPICWSMHMICCWRRKWLAL